MGGSTCFSGKVELGQGAMTVLAQILAEELDVAYESGGRGGSRRHRTAAPTTWAPSARLNVRNLRSGVARRRRRGAAILLQMAREQLQAPSARSHVKVRR